MTDQPPQGPPPQQPQYGGQQFPPQKKSKTGRNIAIGCGLVTLLFLGGCGIITAITASSVNDAVNESTAGGEGTTGKVVTLAEYEQVTEGMTRTEVETIFDAPPTSNSSSDLGSGLGRIDTITYPGAGFGDMVIIQYDGESKLMTKSQSGLN